MSDTRVRRRTAFVAAAASAALVAGVTAAAVSPGAVAAPNRSLYIVQMADMPAVAYTGGIAGLSATRPAAGKKIDPYSSAVTKYVGYLNGTHDAALKRVGGTKAYDYAFSFNGFAARLSDTEAATLRKASGVVAVSKDELRKIDTSTTPAFLGLTAPGGLWDQLGGTKNAGEGVVVGIIDSGIWPENPSFTDRDADGKLVFQQVPGWHGKCTPGEQFPASKCNQKLISAQWYGEGWGGRTGVKADFPYEYWSARGADGHGSHTAGTAAGNYGVDAVVNGASLGKISGMAPRARVAVYKTCWGIPPEGGCFGSDSVAAIDQAVADGVDVLNFSISGSTTSFLDPVEVAFLFAADAGVFVAASAGNSGPPASTVAHNSPWLTTVAAGTHDRQYSATVTLGNGVSYTGAGLGAAVPTSPLVRSVDVGLATASATAVLKCFSGSLDPAKTAGKIVVCDRGTNARTDKSLAVKMARGVGMVLINTNVNTLNADLHEVPTVHLPVTYRDAVRAYAASAGATASLSAGVDGVGALAPDVASFSSRGPAKAGSGDLLKPDIMAPGVDVLAAMSPIEAGRNFDFLSGTSMSSPHMAGLGALLKQQHPRWSPAAIKSAFMTTASQKRNNGTAIPGNPFGFGAGQVTPNSAADPGLVYDAGWTDWLGFLCGTGQLTASYCPRISIDPSDLNYPSIAIGSLVGSQTVTRTVTNVASTSETYTAKAAMPGVDIDVTPSGFTLAPGASKKLTVTFTVDGAPLDAYAFGALTLSGTNGHVARSPIAVKPVAFAAPASVSGTGAAGSTGFTVAFGYTGAYSAAAHGLVAATENSGTILDDPTDSTCSLSSPNAVKVDVVVPAGTALARFATTDDTVNAGSDLDMCVFTGVTEVGSSAGGTAAEQVDLVLPEAGTYTVVVQGWQTAGGTPSPYTLFSWVLANDPDANDGSLTVVAPASATSGTTGQVTASWSGLATGKRYLGAISHTGPDGLLGRTTVSVRT